MKILWTTQAQEDYQFWVKKDLKIVKRVHALIKDIQNSPFRGIGKPEALKYDLQGYWSRRITKEHRLVYKVQDGILYIAQCRYHY